MTSRRNLLTFLAFATSLTATSMQPCQPLGTVSRAAIRHAYESTQACVAKSYEDARIVYELQTRLRQFPPDPTSEQPKGRR
jgi:hypothetical protein